MWLPKLKLSIGLDILSKENIEFFKQKQRYHQWSGLAFSLRNDRFDEFMLNHDLMLFKELVIGLRCSPPLGLVLDLFALFRKGDLFSTRIIMPYDRPFERLLLRLQNDLYYRLLRMSSFQTIRQFLSRLPEHHSDNLEGSYRNLSVRDRALIYLVEQFLEPVKEFFVEPYPPQFLSNEMKEKDFSFVGYTRESIVKFEEMIEKPHWLVAQLEMILECYVHLSESFKKEWQVVLSHFDLLSNKLERVRWQQMAWSFEQFEPFVYSEELLEIREIGYNEIKLPTGDIISEGGIQGLSHRGHLSSLLATELLYWEDDPQQVDLFALRWLENELLFYEREQQISYTKHRTFQIFLNIDIGEIRYKSRDMAVSGLSLLWGFLSRLTVDLRAFCAEEVLSIEYYLAPSSQWKKDFATYQLFLNSAEGVGGSTSFQLSSNLSELTQNYRDGDFRLLVVTPKTWENCKKKIEDISYHLILFVVASEQLISDELKKSVQKNKKSYSFVEERSFEEEQSFEGSPREMIADNPDLLFFLDTSEENLKELSEMREFILGLVLRRSPRI